MAEQVQPAWESTAYAVVLTYLGVAGVIFISSHFCGKNPVKSWWMGQVSSTLRCNEFGLASCYVFLCLAAYIPHSIISVREIAGRFIIFPQMVLANSVCMIVLLGREGVMTLVVCTSGTLVAGNLAVLHGLLSEYIELLKKESEGRRMSTPSWKIFQSAWL